MKHILIIFIVLLVLSCDNEERLSIVGSWNYCDEKGNYVELHFLEGGKYVFCPEFNPGGYESLYEIQNDTLLIHNFMNYERPFSIGVQMVNSSELIFNVSLSDHEALKYSLSKINDINILPVGGSKERRIFYKQLFERRKNKSRCIKEVETRRYNRPDLNEIDTSFSDN